MTAPLRIVLNLVPIAEAGGGVTRHAVELVAALAQREDVRLTAVTSRDAPRRLRESAWSGRVRWLRAPVRTTGRPWHLAAQFGLVPAVALATRAGVVHSPANAGPVRVPGCRSVITLHDLIWLHEGERWSSPESVRAMWRIAVPTVRRADLVLAVSEHARRDAIDSLGLDPGRVHVVPNGVSAPGPATPEQELRERLSLPAGAPVVLCVAQHRPYKRQDALLHALPRLPEARLVLVGGRTAYTDELAALAVTLGVEQRLHLPGHVDEPDLEGLYRLATCVALPSSWEGFGLPVLEAMVRGVPVACSDRAALPEIAGDAALLFDPDDATAVVDALARLLGDAELRAELAGRGARRAADFTWEKVAAATVAAYRRAIDG